MLVAPFLIFGGASVFAQSNQPAQPGLVTSQPVLASIPALSNGTTTLTFKAGESSPNAWSCVQRLFLEEWN